MPKKGNAPLQGELLQGTLDLVILRTLMSGPAHGHTIAHVIEHQSEDVLQIEHGSLLNLVSWHRRVYHVTRGPSHSVSGSRV